MPSSTPTNSAKVRLDKLFKAIDSDSTGYINATKLRHFLSSQNFHLSDNEIAHMISMYDEDGDARLSLQEFKGLVNQLKFEAVPDATPLYAKKDDSNEHAENIFEDSPRVSQDSHSTADGLIALSEISDPRLRNALSKMNENGSGHLSIREIEEAIEEHLKLKGAYASSNECKKNLSNGLSSCLNKVNHIALIVSDVGRSVKFYSDVIGFKQIQRPDFDRHGAWFTMGNLELHLIKGKPLVHSGDDLIVGHISLETSRIDDIAGKLEELSVPYRQNVSVPKGHEILFETNTNASSSKIVKQYFIRDPDGYYIEICDCDVLTDFCFAKEGNTGDIMDQNMLKAGNDENNAFLRKWIESGQIELKKILSISKEFDAKLPSIRQIARFLGGRESKYVDHRLLRNLETRQTVYGDICQNEDSDSLCTIALESGNDVHISEKIMIVRQILRGKQTLRPPAFVENGNLVYPPAVYL